MKVVMTTSPAPETGTPWRRSPAARAAATAQEAQRPVPRGFGRALVRLVADVVRKGDRDRVLGLAGENAFMAILTVFPILLVVAAVVGRLSLVIGADNARRVEDTVLRFLQDLLTERAGPAIETARGLFESSGNTLTIALVLAFGSLAQACASIINTVTLVYDVHDTRGWWKRRALGLLVGLGSVLMAVLVVTLRRGRPAVRGQRRGAQRRPRPRVRRRVRLLALAARLPGAGPVGHDDVPHLPGPGRARGGAACRAAC